MMFYQISTAAAFMGTMFWLMAVERIRMGAFTSDAILLLALCGVGSVIGAFASISVRHPRNPTVRNLALRWVVSVLVTTAVGPFFVEVFMDRTRLQASPFGVIAFSMVLSFVAWQTLTEISRRWTLDAFRDWVKRILNL